MTSSPLSEAVAFSVIGNVPSGASADALITRIPLLTGGNVVGDDTSFDADESVSFEGRDDLRVELGKRPLGRGDEAQRRRAALAERPLEA